MKRLAPLIVFLLPATLQADPVSQALADCYVALIMRSALAARPAPPAPSCGCSQGIFCRCGCPDGLPCDCADCVCVQPTYSRQRERALAEGKCLVVWVGRSPERAVSAALRGVALQVHCREFPGVAGDGVVVSRPAGGTLEWLETLDPGATAEQVRQVLRRPVQAPAPPIQPPSVPAGAPVLFRGGGFGGGRACRG